MPYYVNHLLSGYNIIEKKTYTDTFSVEYFSLFI